MDLFESNVVFILDRICVCWAGTLIEYQYWWWLYQQQSPVSLLAKTSDQCAASWENLWGCLISTLLLMLLVLRCLSLPCMIIPSSSFCMTPEVLSACSLGKSIIFWLTSSGNFRKLQALFLFIPPFLHPPNFNICNIFLRNSSVWMAHLSQYYCLVPLDTKPMIPLIEQFKLSVIKIIT